MQNVNPRAIGAVPVPSEPMTLAMLQSALITLGCEAAALAEQAQGTASILDGRGANLPPISVEAQACGLVDTLHDSANTISQHLVTLRHGLERIRAAQG